LPVIRKFCICKPKPSGADLNIKKEVLRECERHVVDYRSPMNFTPLMAAAATGNTRKTIRAHQRIATHPA
jgi:hypothetical protein